MAKIYATTSEFLLSLQPRCDCNFASTASDYNFLQYHETLHNNPLPLSKTLSATVYNIPIENCTFKQKHEMDEAFTAIMHIFISITILSHAETQNRTLLQKF